MDLNKSAVHNIEWHIKNISDKSLIDGKRVDSTNFEIIFDEKVTKWYLCAVIKESNLGIFLHQSRPILTGFITKWEIFIRTSNNEIKKKWQWEKDFSTIESGFGYGSPSFISVSKIFKHADQYLKNGTLTIRIKIELIKIMKKSVFKPKNQTESPQQAIFKSYFNNKALSDITFICSDDVKVPAHRFAIAASSPVWNNIIERVPDIKKIEVDDIDSETMNEILRYIYTEEVSDNVKFAPKLINGAIKYGLDGLKKLCVTTMLNNMTVENVINYFLLADQYDLKESMDHYITFIGRNRQTLMKNKNNWNKLTKKHLNMILEKLDENPEYILLIKSSL